MTIPLESWAADPIAWSAEADTSPDELARVLEWLTGEAPSGEAESGVEQTITMDPMTITLPPGRYRSLMRSAGWMSQSIQVMMRDYNNEILTSHVCFLQYQGPTGQPYTGRGELVGGSCAFPDFWLKPSGVLRLMAVPIAGTSAEGGPVLEGTLAVPAQLTTSSVVLSAVQDHSDITLNAANQQSLADQIQVQGSVKFSILGTAEIGGGGGSTTTTTGTVTRSYAYTVRIARPSLVISVAPRS